MNESNKGASSSAPRLVYLVTLYGREKVILWVMGALQIAWLGGIGLLGASSDWAKLIGIAIYSLIAMSVVLVFSDRLALDRLEKVRPVFRDDKRLILILLGLCLFTGVIYANFQRVWIFDGEENYRLASVFASQGAADFLSEYSRSPYFANQHPPLVALVYGSVMSVFGVNLLVSRLVSLLFCMGILWLTYLCGRELFDSRTGLLSAGLLFTFPLIMRLGTVAMLDIPVTFFFLLCIYLFLSLAKKPSLWIALLLGIAIGAGFLSRYSGIFVVPVLMIFALLSPTYRRVIPYLFLAFLLIGLVLIGWLVFVHGLGLTVPNFSRLLPIGLKASGQAPSVVPGWMFNPKVFNLWRFAMNSLVTRLPSGIGVHNLPLIALGAALVVYSRRIPGVMLLTWIAVVSLILLLTLPDHRYFMPTFPAMAILAGFWLRDRPVISIAALTLGMLLVIGDLYLFVDWQREAQLFTP